MSETTHAELVNRAVNWLKNSMKCLIVLSEQGGGSTLEKPDAIGWYQGSSILVECKTSISDLRADFLKPSRKYSDLAIGSKRYYMIPKEIEEQARKVLPEAKMDEWAGWGLLVCCPGIVKIAWSPRGRCLSVLGKQYEDEILLATLARIAWRINPMTISQFLRLPSSQMRSIEMQEDKEPINTANDIGAGVGA